MSVMLFFQLLMLISAILSCHRSTVSAVDSRKVYTRFFVLMCLIAGNIVVLWFGGAMSEMGGP